MCCHTPDKNFSKEFNRKTAYKSDLIKKVIILSADTIGLHLTPFILETTRARSNLVEIRKLKGTNGLILKMINFGCWPHFDPLTSWKQQA